MFCDLCMFVCVCVYICLLTETMVPLAITVCMFFVLLLVFVQFAYLCVFVAEKRQHLRPVAAFVS